MSRFPRSLSDLKNRREKAGERGQILTISPGNSGSIAQESGEIWTAQRLLQPISFKSDRLPEAGKRTGRRGRGGLRHSLVNCVSTRPDESSRNLEWLFPGFHFISSELRLLSPASALGLQQIQGHN